MRDLSRRVAQPGSAPVSGSGGRRFESSLADHFPESFLLMIVFPGRGERFAKLARC